jgi:two-component system response regulator AtoC
MTKILVIEDDDAVRENLVELLTMEGYEVLAAEDGASGIEQAIQRCPDLIVCDVNMPGQDGFEVFEVLSGHTDTAVTPFIFLSARAARADVRRGMALGADDFITKPFARTELLESVATRLRRRTSSPLPAAPEDTLAPPPIPRDPPVLSSSEAQSRVLIPARPVKTTLQHIILADPSMQELVAQLGRAAVGSIAVLLLGETGVGKEVLAREVHRVSGRRGEFVAVNCAALSESLLESELFGHERGAFTGAVQAREGLFEAAQGGTLFLDEVGELSPSTQVKLLRVLEEKKVVRVGGRVERTLDVRFVAATNRDLELAVAEGEFRQDLFYRLNGLTLQVPPLRDRPGDILALAESFLHSACASSGQHAELEPAAKEALLCYRFPGNIRELRNVIERAVLLSGGGPIGPRHLPAGLLRSEGSPAAILDPRTPLIARLQSLERGRITSALEQSGGNQTQAAALLGISRRTLVTRLSQFDLPRPRKRPPSVPP